MSQISLEDKIYVAGHRGLVGSAIVRSLEAKGYKNIIGRTHKELDLTNQKVIEELKLRGRVMSYSTFSQKLNNAKEREFTVGEIEALAEILQIPDEDLKNYFFSQRD